MPRDPMDTRRPYRCRTCGRVLWTRVDWPYCRTGHPPAEMKLVHPDEVEQETSPDIVTH